MIAGVKGRAASAEIKREIAAGSRSEGMKNIYVLGSGYVGLVTGGCFAEMGHQVTCVDIDASKVARLSKGVIPIYEPDLEPLIKKNLEEGRLRFTTSLEDMGGNADFVFMCVGTPARQDNHVDLSYLEAAYQNIGKLLTGNKTIIVNKSSVPPGTTEKMTTLLNGLLNGHGPARVVANPEFLREGHAVSDFMRPNRVVIGSPNEADSRAVAALYEPLKAPVMFTQASTAEMIKFASNAFLATKLTFINELASLCELVGVNVREVARGIGMDPRIGADYLRAGLGYGGSCLPKDTAILSSQFEMAGIEARLLNTVIEVNSSQARRLVERVETRLGTLRGMKVGVLGLAFKSDTDDTRYSPAINVIRELQARGADVTYYDPKATHTASTFEKPVKKALSIEEAVTGADVTVIATEWREFRELDLAWLRNRMSGTVLADGRNLFAGENVRAAGLTYIGVGHEIVTANQKMVHEPVAD
jgi:UDPglucose 6-dehydrogenase